MLKQQRKIKRLSTLVSILSKYGFREVLMRMNLQSTGDESTEEKSKSVYVRIRKILEELGPTFIKLGQMFSNREDLLPQALVMELQKLQDQVQSTDLDLHEVLEDNFGEYYRDNFLHIETEPIASASIAQVYRAVLANGDKVILKVKRPHVQETIEEDLLLMKDLVKVLHTYFEFAQTLNLEEVLSTFEKSLLSELSLIQERENIERLARNFKGNLHTLVPNIYPELCNNEIFCMTFIEGAKITDTHFHHAHQLKGSQLAHTGLQLYLTQVLEQGFFHADPHAGNILITASGKVVFIDLGAMGTIYMADQELLEDLIINLVSKNVPKLIAILKRMAIRLEIKDEKKLETDLMDIMNMVSNQSLEHLRMDVVLGKFKTILFENQIVMPNYFTLLAKGVVLIESVGRTLDPKFNVMEGVRPYVFKIMKKRMSIPYLFDKGVSKLADFSQDVHQVPLELRNVLLQLNEGKITINNEIKALQKTNKTIKEANKNLILGIILSANIIATSMLMQVPGTYQWLGISIFAILGSLVSIMLAIVLFFNVMKK